MEQLVRVRKLCDDGTAEVVHVRESACSGDCNKCSGCGAARETLLILAKNPMGAQPGELVKLQSESAPVLLAAMMLYVLPLALFFAGYGLGAVLWGRGGIVGCLAFAVGIAGAVLYDRLVAKKKKPVYTIIKLN